MKLKKILLCSVAIMLAWPVEGQNEAYKKLAGPLNKNDFLEVNRLYSQVKDRTEVPVMNAIAEAMLDVSFNRVDQSVGSIGYVIKNHGAELGGGICNLGYLLALQLAVAGRYEEAASVMQQFLDIMQQAGVQQEMIPGLRTMIYTNRQLSGVPAPELVRSGRDCEVPFVRGLVGTKNHIYIPVTINGKSCPFIFDTGASNSMLPAGVAREHGIRIVADSLVDLGAGGARHVRLGVVDSALIGDMVYRNMVVYIGDDTGMAPDTTGSRIDAVLGVDFMRRVGEVQVFPGKQKFVFPAKESVAPAYAPNMMLADGNLCVEGVSGKDRYLFLFDMRAAFVAEMNGKYYERHKEQFSLMEPETVTGGIKTRRFDRQPSFPLEIGGKGVRVRNMDIFPEQAKGVNDGVVGLGWVRRFDKVIFNFNKMFVAVQ